MCLWQDSLLNADEVETFPRNDDNGSLSARMKQTINFRLTSERLSAIFILT